ncbi:DUF2071 domain-containing protein [Lysinibacillus composti]|uniref:DUF2071 domain-containing protein n=2 Tax=Lysinibacillus composti TaxID=720633 RepID=A0A3N9UM60_9BACI|nr:DUF2071 domain-containing protein [Lysinibacillus composti]RQW73612.1 DUF2071 domain-containing protein [Lysinibacillus composti]
MKQIWSDLLFAHYPIKYEVLRKLVPEALHLDSYNGMCWIGVVPFRMSGIRLRGLPSIPGTDQFPELNVRTYVTLDGKPGVYFFSLDAANWLAVKGAKTLYHLPYWHADMEIKNSGTNIEFKSKRLQDNEIELACSYRPISEPFQASKGSFEEWMVERYCFYTLNSSGVPLRCDILHEPWRLQEAEAEFRYNSILSKQGIDVASDSPIVHFAKKIEVRAWPLVHHSTDHFST